MRKLLLTAFIFFSLLSFDSIAQNSQTALLSVIDSSVYKVDSVISKIKVKGNNYQIIIAKDKYDDKQKKYAEGDYFFSPITIFIYDNSTSKTIFKKKYDENEFFTFLNVKNDTTQDGLFYLGMLSSGGGSGYIGTLYSINFENEPKLVPLFDFSELSHVAIDFSGKKFVHIQGIWNFDENEAHFSNHRYTVFTHSIDGEKVITKKLGKTKFKYSSFDDDMPLDEIFKSLFVQEPKLVKDIDINRLKFGF